MKSDFVKEWVERGKNEKNYVYQFFCYFIAFNWLYNCESNAYEYKRIAEYVKKQISKWNNYDPFLFLREDWKNPVQDARTGKIKDYIIKEKDKIIQLFLQIYQVRCNLFHGSKSMMNDRNRVLVEDSCKVLCDFLNRIINDVWEGDDYAS